MRRFLWVLALTQAAGCQAPEASCTVEADAVFLLQGTASLLQKSARLAPSVLQPPEQVAAGKLNFTIPSHTESEAVWEKVRDRLPEGSLRENETVFELVVNRTWYIKGPHFLWPTPGAAGPSKKGVNAISSVGFGNALTMAVAVVAMVLLNIFVVQKFSQDFAGHLCGLGVFLACAAAYNCLVWYQLGSDPALLWLDGYVMEWALSVDNLFVFYLVFKSFKVPAEHIPFALNLGILGAVALRIAYFLLMGSLFQTVHVIRIPFGLLLVWSGIQVMRQEDEDEEDVSDGYVVQSLSYCCGSRLNKTFGESNSVFTKTSAGLYQLNMLFVVIVVLEVSDIIFALDSISAKLAQIDDFYICFSSTILALFGLRALYYILDDCIHMFSMLKLGVCMMLVIMGLELVFHDQIKLSAMASLAITLSILFISTVGSLVWLPVSTKADESKQDVSEPVEVK